MLGLYPIMLGSQHRIHLTFCIKKIRANINFNHIKNGEEKIIINYGKNVNNYFTIV
jgi:hypothetical protein